MTNPAPAVDTPATPPPMPSIAASALLESRQLIALTRRAVVAWLART